MKIRTLMSVSVANTETTTIAPVIRTAHGETHCEVEQVLVGFFVTWKAGTHDGNILVPWSNVRDAYDVDVAALRKRK